MRATDVSKIHRRTQEKEIEYTNRALIPNEPLLPLKCQIQHADDSLDFLIVPLNRTRDPLRMRKIEPIPLSKIGALSTHLEEQVLALKVFFWLGSIANLVLRIVFLSEVLDDGARFP